MRNLAHSIREIAKKTKLSVENTLSIKHTRLTGIDKT